MHPIYNFPSVVQTNKDAVSGLRAAGCNVIALDIARDPEKISEIIEELKQSRLDLLVFFFCTWVAEEIPLSIASELKDVPLLLWALPYFDRSIPMPSPMTGLTSTGCNLQRAGRIFVHRIGEVTADEIQAVARVARNAALVGKLREARFGIIGAPCPGMIDTACDDSELQTKFGFTTINLNIENLLKAVESSSEEEAHESARKLMARAGSCEVDPETVTEQYRLCLGMKALIQEHRLDGFSVRCWPELRDQHKLLICTTMAELAESGIVSACEADLTALATAFILTSISGQPCCTLEITAYLENQKALQMAHCGSASLSLNGDSGCAAIRSHMRTGTGALVEFGLKPGLATIAKLLRSRNGSYKLFVGRGEVIPTDPEVRGSVATVKTEPSPDQFLNTMLEHGVEHHLVIAYGDWTQDLMQFVRFADVEIIQSSSN